MKFTVIEDSPRKFSFKLADLRTAEGAIYGNSLRRATSTFSKAYALCALNIVVDGVVYKAYNTPINGIEEQLASIVLAMKDTRLRVNTDTSKIGDVERLIYEGDDKAITLDMLQSNTGNIDLNLDNLTKPKVIINNINGCHIHLEVVYIYNSGDSLKDYNKLYLSESGCSSEDYLIFNSKHSDVLTSSFSITPTVKGEDMLFTLETINISAKKLVLETLHDLDTNFMSIVQNIQTL